MAVTNNLSYDLAAVATEPLWVKSGSGGIAGDTITDDYEIVRTDLVVGGDNNFLIEAVLSSGRPAGVAEAGARLWVRAKTDDLAAPNQFHEIQVHLMKEASDSDNFVGLCDQNGNWAQDAGSNDAKLTLRWDETAPRYRIRLMRQGSQILLEAEPSNVWDTHASKQSVIVDLNNTNFPPQIGAPNLQEIGFGNGLASNNETSTWEQIHVTACDDSATALPYWPATPPAPSLTFDDKGVDNLQGVDFESDLAALAYLANDQALFHLGAAAQGPVADPSTASAGLHQLDFDSLNDDQTLNGSVEVTEVAGRSVTGPTDSVDIPDRTSPDADIEVRPDNTGVWETPTGSYNAATEPNALRVIVDEAHINAGASRVIINGDIPGAKQLTDLDGSGAPTYLWDNTVGPIPWQQGTNTVEVELVDQQGQTNVATIQISFDLDTIAPDGTIKISLNGGATWIDPVAAPPVNQNVLVGIRLIDNHRDDLHYDDGVQSGPFPSLMTLDTADHVIADSAFGWQPVDATDDILYWLTPVTAQGAHTVSFFLQDAASNSRTIPAASFAIDTAAPNARIEVNDGSGWVQPGGASYPSGTIQVSVAVPTAELPFNETASYLQIVGVGQNNLQTLGGVVDGSDTRFEWPVGISADGVYVVQSYVEDTATNANPLYVDSFTLGALPDFFIDGSATNTPNAALVSHTHDDGTNNDPAGLILFGNNNDNFIGVRISNETGAGTGDCKYRVFTIPACLFVGTTEWRLISNGAPPVVHNIASGTDKLSTGNQNFNDLHSEFPGASDPLWTTHAYGDILHTCTCAVLHASNDPLMLPDGGGGTVAVTDAEFDDPAQFRTQVMDKIDSYTGSTGGYWEAVRNNKKIANRNINIKNVTP